MNRTLAVVLLSAASFFISAKTHAGTVSGAKVSFINTASFDAAFIHVNVAPTNVAACATVTASQYRFVVNLNTASGRAILNQATVAMALGKTLSIVGSGDCAVWGDTESV
jgi:flavin reductase (DIM6/NTAB) family NADH-FMN oxidoreductase RutF